MKTVRELLKDADPLRDEPTVPQAQREFRRKALVAAASRVRPQATGRRFPIARFAVVSFLVVGVLFLGWRVWPRMASKSYAAVRFEVRLAEDQTGPGLQEAMIDGKTIYLHEEVVVTNGDVARAEVIPGNNRSEFWVSVELNEPGAEKMRKATEGHIGKRMAILVEDVVVVAPTVRSAVGAFAVINGDYPREQAERIANGIGAN